MVAVEVVVEEREPLGHRLVEHGGGARGDAAVAEAAPGGLDRRPGEKAGAFFIAVIGLETVGEGDVDLLAQPFGDGRGGLAEGGGGDEEHLRRLEPGGEGRQQRAGLRARPRAARSRAACSATRAAMACVVAKLLRGEGQGLHGRQAQLLAAAVEAGGQGPAGRGLLDQLQDAGVGIDVVAAPEEAGGRFPFLVIALVEVEGVPVALGDHRQIGDGVEAGEPLRLAEVVNRLPVLVGDAAEHGKDLVPGGIGGELRRPARRRPLEIPDHQGDVAEGVLHVAGRLVAELEEVVGTS